MHGGGDLKTRHYFNGGCSSLNSLSPYKLKLVAFVPTLERVCTIRQNTIWARPVLLFS